MTDATTRTANAGGTETRPAHDVDAGDAADAEEENTSYGLEAFEVFLISVPPLARTLGYVVAATLLVGLVPLIEWLTVGREAAIALWPLFPAILAATLVGGELFRWLVPAYPRDWGYFLAFVDQLLATGALVLAALVPGLTVTTAATIAAGAMALNALQVLLISTSTRGWPRTVVATLPQPVVFLGVLLAFGLLGGFGPLHAVAILTAMGGVVLAARLAEWIVAVNVDVRGLDFAAALTLDTELDMGIGEDTRRPVQWLEIDNVTGPIRVVAPWFHPGLMSRIGGGRTSREITGYLERNGRGSYVKPPVSHKSDPADPAAVQEMLATEPTFAGEGATTATRMIEHTLDGLTFRARQYGDRTVVWFDSTEFDDVEMPVFRETIDPETTLVVDCHAHEPDETRNLLAGTTEADRFREGLATVLDRVAEEPQEAYAAGFAAFDDEVPGFAFVEEVGEQRTLVLGLDGNNVTAAYRDLADRLAEGYDRVLLLTTDTHASPFEIDALPAVDAAREAVEVAAADVSTADVSLGSARTSPVTVLGDEYTKLMDSFNIGARFLIVSLGLSYLYLVAAVAFVAAV